MFYKDKVEELLNEFDKVNKSFIEAVSSSEHLKMNKELRKDYEMLKLRSNESLISVLSLFKNRYKHEESETESFFNKVEKKIVEAKKTVSELLALIERANVEKTKNGNIKKKHNGNLAQKNDTDENWIRVLHLSDLHFGIYEYKERKKQKKADFKKIVYDELFKCLNEYKNKIDFVAITGDISYRNSNDGYRDFANWINKLKKVLKIKKIRKKIVICPGNHDSSFTEYAKDGLKINLSRDEEYECVELTEDNTLKRNDKQFSKYNDTLKLMRIKNYSTIFNKNLSYVAGIKKTKNTNFVILNSAWNAFPKKFFREDGVSEENNFNSRGNLLLGKPLINFVKKELEKDQEKDQLTISLFHHPLSWLHECETRSYSRDRMPPTMKIVRDFSDIILNGHIHGKIEPPDTLANKTLVFYGGSLFPDEGAYYQFEIISINKNEKYCTQEIFTYNISGPQTWEKEDIDSDMRFFWGDNKIAAELLAQVMRGKMKPIDVDSLKIKDNIKELFRKMYHESKLASNFSVANEQKPLTYSNDIKNIKILGTELNE